MRTNRGTSTCFFSADHSPGPGGAEHTGDGGPGVQDIGLWVRAGRGQQPGVRAQVRGPAADPVDGARVAVRQHVLGQVGRVVVRRAHVGDRHARLHPVPGDGRGGRHEAHPRRVPAGQAAALPARGVQHHVLLLGQKPGRPARLCRAARPARQAARRPDRLHTAGQVPGQRVLQHHHLHKRRAPVTPPPPRLALSPRPADREKKKKETSFVLEQSTLTYRVIMEAPEQFAVTTACKE